MAGAKQRIEQQPAWVLHTYPWRETSLIVEIFAREHGRVALVAKGARRPHSQLRGVLLAFQPLWMDWSGGGEVKTLVRAEWQGGQLGRGEPESPILRRFELALLQELGYEAGLAHEGDSGEPVRPEGRYLYIIERGPLRLESLEEEGVNAAALGEQPLLSGQTLLDMAAGDFSRAETLAQSKQLLRMLINHTLGGQPLQSRRVLKELQEL
jgi:DNA repair protein RecO (recombination protein O)